MRELHFAVERAGLLAEGEKIDLHDLPPEIVEKGGRAPVPAVAPAEPAEGPEAEPTTLPLSEGDGPDVERVRAALEMARWRREKAAEILGVSPRTLYRWIKKLGL